jgi:hypothetical protein
LVVELLKKLNNPQYEPSFEVDVTIKATWRATLKLKAHGFLNTYVVIRFENFFIPSLINDDSFYA